MKLETFYLLAEEAGFMFWNDESWKPEGSVIDWSAQYDQEFINLFRLVKNYYEGKRENVEVDLTDQEMLDLFKIAHEKDITLNELVDLILRKAMIKSWTDANSLEDRGSLEE